MRPLIAFALPLIFALGFAPHPAFAQGADAGAAKPAETKPADTKKADTKKTDATADEKKTDAKTDTKTDTAAKPDEKKPEEAGPSPTPTTPTATAPKATSGSGQMDGATYQVRLRELEQRVDELKEQIRRSHTRLSLLSETILSGGVGGARVEIRFANEMSNIFRLNRALFVLDGAVQYNKQDDTGALAAQKEIPIFQGSVPPGDHTLQVLLQFRGYGYGMFSYLRGYRFEVKSTHSFTVTEGKAIDLTATAYEKGGVTTPVEQRPALRFLEKLKSGAPGGGAPASPSGSGLGGSFSFGSGGK
jgi:hypothetical protein